jgi:hypothetical protein
MTPEEAAKSETAPKEALRVSAGGGLVIAPQPEESCYPLRREEFDILCGGEVTQDDARWRDVLIGVSATALAGLLGLAYTSDWDRAFSSRSWGPFIVIIIFATAFLATGCMARYLHYKVRRHKEASSHSRTRSKIEAGFQEVQGKTD